MQTALFCNIKRFFSVVTHNDTFSNLTYFFLDAKTALALKQVFQDAAV